MKKSTMNAIDRAHEREQRKKRREAKLAAAGDRLVEKMTATCVDVETAGLAPWASDITKIPPEGVPVGQLDQLHRAMGGGVPYDKLPLRGSLDTEFVGRHVAQAGKLFGDKLSESLSKHFEDIRREYNKADRADDVFVIDSIAAEPEKEPK